MDIPRGSSREDIKQREQIIKDLYAHWIADHPDKMVWNDNLQDYIHIRFLSINETYEKAARNYESTVAVTRLSEVLKNAIKVDERPAKLNVKNQKAFETMLIMRYENIKLTVGVQRSSQNKIQYCITAIQ